MTKGYVVTQSEILSAIELLIKGNNIKLVGDASLMDFISRTPINEIDDFEIIRYIDLKSDIADLGFTLFAINRIDKTDNFKVSFNNKVITNRMYVLSTNEYIPNEFPTIFGTLEKFNKLVTKKITINKLINKL